MLLTTGDAWNHGCWPRETHQSLPGWPTGRSDIQTQNCSPSDSSAYDARIVPLQTGEEPSLGVAMHIIETLVLDDAWQRTDTFCPEGEMFHCGVVAR